MKSIEGIVLNLKMVFIDVFKVPLTFFLYVIDQALNSSNRC